MVRHIGSGERFEVFLKCKQTLHGLIYVPIYSALHSGLKGAFYYDRMIIRNTHMTAPEGFKDRFVLQQKDIISLEEVFCMWRSNKEFWPGYVARQAIFRGITAYDYWTPKEREPRTVPADAYAKPEKYGLQPPFVDIVERNGITFNLERCYVEITRRQEFLGLLHEEEVKKVEELLLLY
ncbi:MAG: hypothetical protein HY363_04925, partial [Candidatus Aenigmarchaeota archaeon]|nr:hypothetical protein [Candidatus Aenigmarchaeota archaeon]